MMGFGSMLKEKLKNMASKGSFGIVATKDPPQYQYGDRITQDERVINLRRQRNRQLDMEEKKRLEAQIKAYEFRMASEGIVGKTSLFKSKREPTVKTKSCGFFGKGML